MKKGQKKAGKDVTVYFRFLAALYTGLMFSVFILWFQEGGFAVITESKYYFFRNLTLAYFILNAVLCAELICIGELKPVGIRTGLKRVGAARWCMIAYAAIAAVSAMASQYRENTWIGLGRYEGLSTILLYVGVFLLISVFGHFERWMVWLMAAAGTVLCIVSLLQFNGFNPFGLYQGEYHYDGVFLGTIGNINMIGTIFCMVIPLMMAAIAVGKDKRRYWLLLPLVLCSTILTAIRVDAALVGIAGVCVFLIPIVCPTAERLSGLCAGYAALAAGGAITELFDFTRANEVGVCVPSLHKGFFVLLAAAVLMGLLSRVLQSKAVAVRIHARWVRILSLAVIACGAVGALVILKWFCPVSSGFIYELSKVLNGEADPAFGSHRVLIWTESAKLVKEHPFLGAGPDTLAARLVLDVVLDPTVSTEVQSVVADSAHNEYLNILVNTGIFSLIAYLSGLIILAVYWIREALKNDAAAILGAAVLGYCIQAFFSFSITITTPLFWILAGLLCGLSQKDG